MSLTFTKLFSSLPESTIWVEPYATRIVWITMLATADREGRVFASMPGLAKRAAVTLEECEAAVARFLEPDKYSRTPDHDGRRIEPIDGGWVLLNYGKYREMRDDEARREQNRIASAKYREGLKVASANLMTGADNKPASANPSAQAEAEADTKPKPLRAASAAPAAVLEVPATRYSQPFEAFWTAWPASKRKVAKAACWRKWQAQKLDPAVTLIVTWVETMKRSEQWRQGFEPAPLTAINQRRWEDGDPGGDAPGEKPWFLTSSGIELKGREIGLAYDDVEPWPDFRNRVFTKAGVTREQFEDARRQWST